MSKLYEISLLDKKISPACRIREISPPYNGWISSIRQTFEMTQEQLAKKLKVNKTRIKKIEDAEVNRSLKLSTLEKTAKALGCQLHYILLPEKETFTEQINELAKKIAEKMVTHSANHMALEDQESTQEIEAQINTLAQELLHNKLKEIWNYEI